VQYILNERFSGLAVSNAVQNIEFPTRFTFNVCLITHIVWHGVTV